MSHVKACFDMTRPLWFECVIGTATPSCLAHLALDSVFHFRIVQGSGSLAPSPLLYAADSFPAESFLPIIKVDTSGTDIKPSLTSGFFTAATRNPAEEGPLAWCQCEQASHVVGVMQERVQTPRGVRVASMMGIGCLKACGAESLATLKTHISRRKFPPIIVRRSNC